MTSKSSTTIIYRYKGFLKCHYTSSVTALSEKSIENCRMSGITLNYPDWPLTA